MRIGWRQFLKKRFSKSSAYHCVGIEFAGDALHLSALKQRDGELVWSLQESVYGKDWPDQLEKLVESRRLQNTPTYVAVSPGLYQIHQLDRPAVDASEIAQALQWNIRDLIPGAQDLVVDYFDVPVNPSGKNKVNVVALEKGEVSAIVKGLLTAGLDLQAISISEHATSALVADSDDAVITLVQQAGEEICLNIVRQGTLYFSRRLKGYENLASFSVQELEMGIADNLSVEIQRSMDYFESQLRQAPVKKILLALDCKHLQRMSELMQQLMFLPVETLTTTLTSEQNQALCAASYVSLGAALGARPEQAGGVA